MRGRRPSVEAPPSEEAARWHGAPGAAGPAAGHTQRCLRGRRVGVLGLRGGGVSALPHPAAPLPRCSCSQVVLALVHEGACRRGAGGHGGARRQRRRGASRGGAGCCQRGRPAPPSRNGADVGTTRADCPQQFVKQASPLARLGCLQARLTVGIIHLRTQRGGGVRLGLVHATAARRQLIPRPLTQPRGGATWKMGFPSSMAARPPPLLAVARGSCRRAGNPGLWPISGCGARLGWLILYRIEQCRLEAAE